VLAAPFVFHSLNGVRHLVWDVTKGQFYHLLYIMSLIPPLPGLSNTAVKRSGYAVLAGTVVGTAALIMI
jgi:succinate dehydrogenase (ubiquinone) cytochrome b560 subunit